MAIILAEKEIQTTKEIAEKISKHFEIYWEVWGYHGLTGKKKRIDAVLTPKKHLNDFPELPIGLELKPKALLDGNKKQIIELSKQAIGYRHTRFKMKSGLHFLPLILIYPPCSNYLQFQQSSFEEGFYYPITRLLGKYFIGELVLDDPKYEFKIFLCGQEYYKYKNGRGKRLNLNWNFEKYETIKKELSKTTIDSDEYETEILKISDLLGL